MTNYSLAFANSSKSAAAMKFLIGYKDEDLVPERIGNNHFSPPLSEDFEVLAGLVTRRNHCKGIEMGDLYVRREIAEERQGTDSIDRFIEEYQTSNNWPHSLGSEEYNLEKLVGQKLDELYEKATKGADCKSLNEALEDSEYQSTF